MERIKTFILMTGLVLLFMFVGNLIGGEQGMMTAFLIACGLNFFSYFFSDSLVLNHYKAKEVNQNTAPLMYKIVKDLSEKAHLPMPKLYVVDEQVPNAFATGRNPKNAAVAATQGLLQLLSPEEIAGVLAHEMSHVKHYDILISSVAASFAGAISMLGRFSYNTRQSRTNRSNGLAIIGVILAPIAAAIVQMAISRAREFRADEGAAHLTRHPEWLIAALLKLEDFAKKYKMTKATPQTAHFFIINPFSGQVMNDLFATHPKTEDRIARLKELQKNI